MRLLYLYPRLPRLFSLSVIAPAMIESLTRFASSKPSNRTLAYQGKLPKLPIPSLEETCKRYLRALQALQDEKEHAITREAVNEFLETDGPKLHEMLKEYAQDRSRYVLHLFLAISLKLMPGQLHRGVLVTYTIYELKKNNTHSTLQVRIIPIAQRSRSSRPQPVLRTRVRPILLSVLIKSLTSKIGMTLPQTEEDSFHGHLHSSFLHWASFTISEQVSWNQTLFAVHL